MEFEIFIAGDVGSMLFGLKPVVKEKQKPVKSDSKNQKRGDLVSVLLAVKGPAF